MLKPVVAVSLFSLVAVPVAADPAVGIWQTEPDRKNLISHIEIRDCGEAVCGRILRAFDQQGQEVETPNIGKELFWDMVPQGDGAYANGTAWVPLLDVQVEASMVLSGSNLQIEACKGAVCENLTWVRVQ
jgi:uncharacterized protein (DUF2147 family)